MLLSVLGVEQDTAGVDEAQVSLDFIFGKTNHQVPALPGLSLAG